MITTKDIDKQCFLKCKIAGSDHYTWENMHARIVGIHYDQHKVILKMPHGERVAVDIEDVRVLEPRPA
jgi:hypothetical protein